MNAGRIWGCSSKKNFGWCLEALKLASETISLSAGTVCADTVKGIDTGCGGGGGGGGVGGSWPGGFSPPAPQPCFGIMNNNYSKLIKIVLHKLKRL